MSQRIAVRRGTAAVVASFVVVFSAIGYSTYALLAPLPVISPIAVPFESISTSAAVVSMPEAGGAAIAEADGTHLFAGRELDTPRPLASIAKVVTALVVLEEHPIEGDSDGADITLTAADSRLPARYRAIDGAVAPAPQGLTLTQRQIIELLLVPSANNYAETLAVWAFGSEDAYIAAARSWLDARGLDSIRIGDATGFSLLNTGTPRELVALARLALADPVVARAAALSVVSVTGVGTFDTTNLALGSDGITGLKTGTLDGVGSNLLFSGTVLVKNEPVDVVGVVLGLVDQPEVARAVRALVSSATDDFHRIELAQVGTVVARYSAPWGDTAELRVAEGVGALVWGPVTTRAVLDAPQLQVGTDTAPPSLIVRYGSQHARVDLEWSGSIDPPPPGWLLAQPIELLFAG